MIIRLFKLLLPIAILTGGITACGESPSQRFDGLLQRELNHEAITMHGAFADVRGYRVSQSGIRVIIDHRYLRFEDSAVSSAIDQMLSGLSIVDNILFAEKKTGYRPNAQSYAITWIDDTGKVLDRKSLAALQARQPHSAKHDMKAWGRGLARLPGSETPAPLLPLADSCDKAQAQIHRAMGASDDANESLSLAKKATRFESGCVTDFHDFIAAQALEVEAFAEHQLGDSDAPVDANLASQDFMKCSQRFYGTRLGAQCQQFAMTMTEMQARWTLGL
jgi:hypothetical protein